MESLLLQTIVQASSAAPCDFSSTCDLWDWLFWIGVVAGVVGGIVSFLKRPIETV